MQFEGLKIDHWFLRLSVAGRSGEWEPLSTTNTADDEKTLAAKIERSEKPVMDLVLAFIGVREHRGMRALMAHIEYYRVGFPAGLVCGKFVRTIGPNQKMETYGNFLCFGVEKTIESNAVGLVSERGAALTQGLTQESKNALFEVPLSFRMPWLDWRGSGRMLQLRKAVTKNCTTVGGKPLNPLTLKLFNSSRRTTSGNSLLNRNRQMTCKAAWPMALAALCVSCALAQNTSSGVQDFTANGKVTVSTGVTSLRIDAYGAGGGGGAATSYGGFYGGGGGGGAYNAGFIQVSPGDVWTIVVGKGGVGGFYPGGAEGQVGPRRF